MTPAVLATRLMRFAEAKQTRVRSRMMERSVVIVRPANTHWESRAI